MRVNYITSDDPAIPRFWSKVHKTDTCWIWTAAFNAQGYGNFRYQGHTYLASRFAFMICVGPIRDRMNVLHRCDNPACVCPDHLFLGTQRDNLRDMRNKGRANQARGDRSGSRIHPEKRPRGEKNRSAKLIPDQVRCIRERYENGMNTQQELADMFGVGATAIYNIIHRRKWRHIP